MLAFYLFAYYISWLFLSTEGWCGKMGMCFLRDCDLNGCMFAVASNLFVWLPGMAGTISIQSNCHVVINTYFTSLQLELSKFLVLFLWKWDLFKYSLLLEHSFHFSHSIVLDSFWPHGLQHPRVPCPSPTLPELAQTHVHRVGDAIQPSHLLSSPSPPAFNLSDHPGLFP